MKMRHPLPSPNQTWAHAVSSKTILAEILQTNQNNITAIEADILMGKYENNDILHIDQENLHERCNNWQPIMAHPPDRISDLSADLFLEMTLRNNANFHLKLDFKELDAVKPVLSKVLLELQNCKEFDSEEGLRCIHLNADVLPGPGMYNQGARISGDDFLNVCHEVLQSSKDDRIIWSYSLGWNTDCRAYWGYTGNNVTIIR